MYPIHLFCSRDVTPTHVMSLIYPRHLIHRPQQRSRNFTTHKIHRFHKNRCYNEAYVPVSVAWGRPRVSGGAPTRRLFHVCLVGDLSFIHNRACPLLLISISFYLNKNRFLNTSSWKMVSNDFVRESLITPSAPRSLSHCPLDLHDSPGSIMPL